MQNQIDIRDYEKKIKRVLITKEEIDDAIKEAGKKIDAIYDGRPILLVSVLKGAFVFMSDLCRAVSVPCEIGFMCAKSYYSGTVSSRWICRALSWRMFVLSQVKMMSYSMLVTPEASMSVSFR